jgi:hypothetical protein
MSTNYYFNSKPCPHCGRADNLHIGNTAAGWKFLFRGYPDIRSYQDWLKRLEAGGEITDEYGRMHTLDEFREMVECLLKDDECYHHPDAWRDAEGYDFCDSEFS